jgi:hypothetical protein
MVCEQIICLYFNVYMLTYHMLHLACPDNCYTCVDGGNGDTSCSVCDFGYQAGTDINGDSYCFRKYYVLNECVVFV